ncbi:MAG: PqqD family protein [Candidatus Brocadiaceae bacterium]|nr:PqqD family protein [Candidatus Brocadiaceae bacterium]
MSNMRCAFVKKGKKTCRNPAIEGFDFCKSHIDQIDSVLRCKVPDHVRLESSSNDLGFIFDANLGHVYYLNTPGTYIFSLMKENKPLSEIVRMVSKRYRVDSTKALSDFRDFYNNLMDLGLIAKHEAS